MKVKVNEIANNENEANNEITHCSDQLQILFYLGIGLTEFYDLHHNFHQAIMNMKLRKFVEIPHPSHMVSPNTSSFHLYQFLSLSHYTYCIRLHCIWLWFKSLKSLFILEFRRRLLTLHFTKPVRNWLIKFSLFSGVQRRLGKNLVV